MRRVMKTGGLARHGFGKLCPTARVYWAVEVASVVVAALGVVVELSAGVAGAGAASIMTVRVEVDVRPDWSVAT